MYEITFKKKYKTEYYSDIVDLMEVWDFISFYLWGDLIEIERVSKNYYYFMYGWLVISCEYFELMEKIDIICNLADKEAEEEIKAKEFFYWEDNL